MAFNRDPAFCCFAVTDCNNGWEGPPKCDRDQRKAGTVTSERQKAANQANARLSTGPKTSKGKAVVRFNALRHGLLARDVVLPEEDADAFEDVRNQVRANFSPVGPDRGVSRGSRGQRYVEAAALGTGGDRAAPFAGARA